MEGMGNCERKLRGGEVLGGWERGSFALTIVARGEVGVCA